MRRQIEWNHIRRFALAAEVSPHVPAFTEHGFQKRSLKAITPGLWTDIQRVFKENASRKRLERFYFEETNYNQRSVQTYVVPSGSICRSLDRDWKLFIAEWGGVTSGTQMTSCYGVRCYNPGSFLMNHVDRTSTHVLSAILNVHQVRKRSVAVH